MVSEKVPPPFKEGPPAEQECMTLSGSDLGLFLDFSFTHFTVLIYIQINKDYYKV